MAMKAEGLPRGIKELREDLHRRPDLSGREERTSAIAASELDKAGIGVIHAEGYSLVGVLEGAAPGKTLALRADMDALPIQENENNLKGKRALCSEIAGAAHMCGHDFHTAALLGAGRRLAARRDSFKGRILFCFESGEEKGCGYKAVLDQLEKLGLPDAGFGIHVRSDFPCGTMAVHSGPCMAGTLSFAVDVHGKSGHGARPDQALDPINCAAQIICSANAILARRVNPLEAAVLGVCSIHGGSIHNRIPDLCRMEGTMRYFNDHLGEKMKIMLEQVVSGTSLANGCRSEMSWRGPCPAVVNDQALAEIARAQAESIQGVGLLDAEPWTASDSMGHYAKAFPCVYAFVGCANEAKGCGAPHHSDLFEADEDCLPLCVELTVRFAEEYLKS